MSVVSNVHSFTIYLLFAETASSRSEH